MGIAIHFALEDAKLIKSAAIKKNLLLKKKKRKK